MAKCSKIGCDKEGTNQPFFSFTAIGYPNAQRAKSIILGVLMCNEHAITSTDEFITDSGWAEFCQSMKSHGLSEPDRKSVRIEYLRES